MNKHGNKNASPHKRILVVDDDEDILSMLKKQLEFWNFDCSCATTVEEALDMLGRVKPHLVILDLGFAHASGTAFLKHARERFGNPDKTPPVVVLSGISDEEVVDYAMDMGAVAFLGKPYSSEELISTVNTYIR